MSEWLKEAEDIAHNKGLEEKKVEEIVDRILAGDIESDNVFRFLTDENMNTISSAIISSSILDLSHSQFDDCREKAVAKELKEILKEEI